MRTTALLAFASLLVPVAAHAAPDPDPDPVAAAEAPPPAEPAPPPLQGSNEFLRSSDHPYLGVSGGVNLVEDLPFDYATAGNKAIKPDYDAGWDIDATVGYDFGSFRAEAEVGYRESSVSAFSTAVTIPTFPRNGIAFSAPPGTFNTAGGTSSALSFMVNGMLDFGDEDGLSGFVGAGAGLARVEYNQIRLYDDANPFLDQGATPFAWQVFAGGRYALSDHIDLNLRFDFFSTNKMALATPTGVPIDARYRAIDLTAGITFNFGK